MIEMRRRYMGGWKKPDLLSEYQQVQYLEAHASEPAIFFTIELKWNYLLHIELMWLDGLNGQYDKAIWSSGGYVMVQRNKASNNFHYFNWANKENYTIANQENNVWFNIDIYGETSSHMLYVDVNDEKYAMGTVSSNRYEFNNVMGLFNQLDCTKRGANCRIRYFYIDNEFGDKIMELIPCYRKSDLVAGMYDLVNNVFYTNVGTGEFIVGPDVN